MDPLTALGLAANVAQLVNYTMELLSVGREIYETGSSSTNEEFSVLANDFRSLTAKLKSSSSALGTSSDDELALCSLATKCVDVADKLTVQLDKLRVQPGQNSNWRTLRYTLSTVWGQDKVNAMVKQLERFRSEVEFRMTVMVKNNMDKTLVRMDERFTLLDKQSQTIIQELLNGSRKLDASFETRVEGVHRRHDQTDVLAQRLHQETMNAINSLNNLSLGAAGISATITSISDFQPQPRIGKYDLDTAKLMFLHMLEFRHIFEREDEIADSHSRTFQWIINPIQNKEDCNFSPLRPWLEAGDGCYWVNGKAGSGKSTLIKFLRKSLEVEKILTDWADQSQLVIASFYAWRGGTEMQRSHEGLLRWLLFKILENRRELIPLCFPDDFENVKEGITLIGDVVISMHLLRKAFLALSSLCLPLKIFFFVDGLDEFDGDLVVICKLLRQLSANPMFKILVSSRPIPACLEVFQGFPSLRLQDLTYDDIKSYVIDNIGEHQRLAILRAEEPDAAEELVQSILSKASGVFLWVTLVVKSLLEGFRNYDRIGDLQKRVNELPQELQELYLHMFQKMELRYQKEASRLLQLVIHIMEVQDERPLTVLHLYLAEDGRLTQAINATVKVFEPQKLQAKCEAMEGRIRSRYCGLVEVVKKRSNSDYPCMDWEVHVLHKSVLEFLRSRQIWAHLVSLTQIFEPNESSMAAKLVEIKVLPPAEETVAVVEDEKLICTVYSAKGASGRLWDCLSYCRLQESLTGCPQTSFLDEVERVIRLRSDMFRTYDPRQKFLCLILEAGLLSHFRVLIDRDPVEVWRQLDPIAVLTRLIRAFAGPKFRHSTGIGDLAGTYVEIVEIVFSYVKSHDTYLDGLKMLWYETCFFIKEEVEIKYTNWMEDQTYFENLKCFLRIIECFLLTEINLNSFSYGLNVSSRGAPIVSLDKWLSKLSSISSQDPNGMTIARKIERIRQMLLEHEIKHMDLQTQSLTSAKQWPIWLELHYHEPSVAQVAVEPSKTTSPRSSITQRILKDKHRHLERFLSKHEVTPLSRTRRYDDIFFLKRAPSCVLL
ncbi:MAG: hypothetical protein MMC33_006111 [Icmadophila ericetorum]|nr:hypothetical protein [Icmadophila ericetorum]